MARLDPKDKSSLEKCSSKKFLQLRGADDSEQIRNTDDFFKNLI